MDGFFLLAVACLLMAGGVLVLGLVSLMVGRIQQKRFWIRMGTRLVVVSIVGAMMTVVAGFAHAYFASKPPKEALVGVYQRSNPVSSDGRGNTTTDFPHTIELKQDGSFRSKSPSRVHLCPTGYYDYQRERQQAELSFKCPDTILTARVEKKIGSFRIEFLVGLPPNQESIEYKKIR